MALLSELASNERTELFFIIFFIVKCQHFKCGVRQSWIEIINLGLAGCVNLGKSFKLSDLPFLFFGVLKFMGSGIRKPSFLPILRYIDLGKLHNLLVLSKI